jgi:hypothetical protein
MAQNAQIEGQLIRRTGAECDAAGVVKPFFPRGGAAGVAVTAAMVMRR